MIKREIYIRYFKLLPILLVLASEFIAFISKTTANYLTGISYIITICFIIRYFKNIPKYLIIFFSIIALYIMIVSLDTYSIEASFLDGLRYLLPFTVMFYGISFKNDFKFLIKALIVIILLNDLYQLISYALYFIDPSWYYFIGNSTNSVKGIIRACGFTHSFDFFAFLNLIGFYLSYQYYNKKYLFIFILFLFLSISFKYIILFGLLLIYLREFKKISLILFCISTIFLVNQNFRKRIFDGVQQKYNHFLIDQNSPRPESYKVLKEHLKNNSIFYAEGSGVFGGPGSTKYNSYYYDKVSFNWHGKSFATTDTYYPHLFIELGLIQGLLYLIFVFIVFVLEHKYLSKFSFIIFIFLFSSIFNFSMNNYIFLLFSFVLILPLIFNEKKKYDL